jgi:hypothetical protein
VDPLASRIAPPLAPDVTDSLLDRSPVLFEGGHPDLFAGARARREAGAAGGLGAVHPAPGHADGQGGKGAGMGPRQQGGGANSSVTPLVRSLPAGGGIISQRELL